jgi:hypothetical protein
LFRIPTLTRDGTAEKGENSDVNFPPHSGAFPAAPAPPHTNAQFLLGVPSCQFVERIVSFDDLAIDLSPEHSSRFVAMSAAQIVKHLHGSGDRGKTGPTRLAPHWRQLRGKQSGQTVPHPRIGKARCVLFCQAPREFDHFLFDRCGNRFPFQPARLAPDWRNWWAKRTQGSHFSSFWGMLRYHPRLGDQS